jgi:mycothiol synthase
MAELDQVRVWTAETDADLAAWREIRLAVVPGERAPSIEQLRGQAARDQVFQLAALGDQVVGSGITGRSDLAGSAFVAVRVRAGARRRGVGTVLLRSLGGYAQQLGFTVVNAGVEDPGSLAFAERFGFREVDRQVEQVRAIGDEPLPVPPSGVRIIPVSQQPELWAAAYHQLAVEALGDLAVIAPIEITSAEWAQSWISDPACMFLALDDSSASAVIIGCAGLILDEDRPDRAENALTAVRRDWRGRGVASALKRTALAWAADHDIREVFTWTQRGNADMRRLNEHLGYRPGVESITLRAPLPLPMPA